MALSHCIDVLEYENTYFEASVVIMPCQQVTTFKCLHFAAIFGVILELCIQILTLAQIYPLH